MKVAAFLLAFSVSSVLLGAAPPAAGNVPGLAIAGTSSWVSREGSVMVLDIGPQGTVQGHFVNNAPGKGCRGIPYELSGRLVADAVSFRVRWRNGVADCMSETLWHGHMQPSRNGGFEIVARWQRSSTVAAADTGIAISENGVDVFTYRASTRLPTSISP